MKFQETRHGGVRRTQSAQITGNVQEDSSEAKPMAMGDVKGVSEGADYLEGQSQKDTGEVGGSNPSLRTKIIVKFNEKLGLPTCPYLIRWRVETPWGSVRVHHWISSDDDRAFHDHPWDFITFVLKGGYTDSNTEGKQHLKAPAVQYRSALHQHTVFPDKGGAWTLVFTGPKIRPWGFWVAGKFKKANKYFLTYGHHKTYPCE